MSLAALRTVLDRAADAAVELKVWWRDDDAVAASPALERLLTLSREFTIPIAIAAIPTGIQPSLPARLREEAGTRLLVHGFSHTNHAGPGRKPAEFGAERPLPARSVDAKAGLARAREQTGELLLPVFVPPWNRIAPGLATALPGLGYVGLSTFGPREPVPGLVVANTHLDPVDWRGSRGAVAPERLAAALERALESHDPGPIGILTHHLVFDEALWTLTRRLLEHLSSHQAIRFPALDEIWRP